MPPTVRSDLCPDCQAPLKVPPKGPLWCSSCEWNLPAYDAELVPTQGWRWLSRRTHATAFRLDCARYTELAASPLQRPGLTLARIVLVVVSALLVLLTLAGIGLGVWLLMLDFPSWAMLPGLLLILLSVAVRPRLGGLPPEKSTLRRQQAPTLFGLIERGAAATGTGMPAVVAVDGRLNASWSRVGLHQRSLLTIGLPLWIVLRPQARVALLAHELAHAVNGDPARDLLVYPALTTFRQLAHAVGGWEPYPAGPPDRPRLFSMIGDLVRGTFSVFGGAFVLWVVSRLFLVVHLGLTALGMRDRQRSEYLADAMAVDVAGTEATMELLDRLLLLPSIVATIGENIATALPARWAGIADALHAELGGELANRRQLTRRGTSLWETHPPIGLRARMVEGRPGREARIVLSEEESARIDQELAGWYASIHQRMRAAHAASGQT